MGRGLHKSAGIFFLAKDLVHPIKLTFVSSSKNTTGAVPTSVVTDVLEFSLLCKFADFTAVAAASKAFSLAEMLL